MSGLPERRAASRPWLVGRWHDDGLHAAHAGGASVADHGVEELAVRLLRPAPYPLFATSMWRGITAVPPQDARAVTAEERTVRHTRWWTR
ncbi:hypothetical protein [Streptomyces viridosporus]|uniref:hypothetical protein n=1 Tax=Streptomyces viridosporus TaxID=67581 RepID=UPI0036F580E6